jgi:glycosyltransferase involved in cell wall biosynthesis
VKVLLSAFACAPGRGSEPGVGWGVLKQAARSHDVWVLTNAQNRDLIARADRKSGVSYVYLGMPSAAYRSASRVLGAHQALYAAWQVRAYLAARLLQQSIGFDLIHHVTYVNSWLPTGMGDVGPPFVWTAGPADETPGAFLGSMSSRGAMGEITRRAALRATRGLRERTASRAKAILTSSESHWWPTGAPVRRMPLGGLDEDEIAVLGERKRCRPGNDKFRVLSVGRLLGWKGHALGIKAFARLHRQIPRSEYWIVGDGPELGYLRDLAQREGCSTAVRFVTWMVRDEVLRLYQEFDVLLHPSFHEQLGYVVLEAMGSRCPVICLRGAGPEVAVRPGTGFTVAATTPNDVVDQICARLVGFANDPVGGREMGEAARATVLTNWSWDSVGRRLMQLYQEVA